MSRKTKDQIEKQKENEALKQELQKQCDKKRMSMFDFQKNWNTKNKNKITEMVKLGDVILIRFGSITIHVNTDKLYL